MSSEDDHHSKPIEELVPHLGNVPVAPAHGIAAIALSMAIKFHDTSTIQDGTLYQQYKLEGKNIQPLMLDHVLATAAQLELWLIGSSERIAKLVVDAIASESTVSANAENPGAVPHSTEGSIPDGSA